MEDSTLSGGNSADNEVLSLLRDLRRDMQSMGDRVASLEGQPRPQSGHDADGEGQQRLQGGHSLDDAEDGRRSWEQSSPYGGSAGQSSLYVADGSDHAHRAGTGHESSTLLMDEEDCGDDVNVMYATVPVWPDEEEGEDDTSNKGTKLFKVLDKTAKCLTSAFTTATPNMGRRLCQNPLRDVK